MWVTSDSAASACFANSGSDRRARSSPLRTAFPSATRTSATLPLTSAEIVAPPPGLPRPGGAGRDYLLDRFFPRLEYVDGDLRRGAEDERGGRRRKKGGGQAEFPPPLHRTEIPSFSRIVPTERHRRVWDT